MSLKGFHLYVCAYLLSSHMWRKKMYVRYLWVICVHVCEKHVSVRCVHTERGCVYMWCSSALDMSYSSSVGEREWEELPLKGFYLKVCACTYQKRRCISLYNACTLRRGPCMYDAAACACSTGLISLMRERARPRARACARASLKKFYEFLCSTNLCAYIYGGERHISTCPGCTWFSCRCDAAPCSADSV